MVADFIDSVYGDYVESETSKNAFIRNAHKTSILLNACRYHIESENSKDTQLLLMGDQHGDSIGIINAIDMLNGFNTLDAIINLGDTDVSHFSEGYATTYFSLLEKAEKPVFHVLGNHDVGYSPLVSMAGSNQQCFNQWVAPVIAKGWLRVGEYQENKCYYYHDFTEGKVRLIILYPYDDDNEFYEGYWKHIDYNASYDNIHTGSAYSVGDRVNVTGFTEYSFECVQAISSTSSSVQNPTVPAYKFYRGINIIRQEQAQWFLDTLASTPENYSVVVAIHGVPSENYTIDTSKGKFCQDLDRTALQFGGYGMDGGTDGINDFLAKAANAFNTGDANFSMTVDFKTYKGYDGHGAKYATPYNVSKDFSQKSAGAKFHCFLCGHTHFDLIWKHKTYDLYVINPMYTGTVWGRTHVFGVPEYASDIVLSTEDGVARDSFTSIAFNNSRGMKKIGLAKIGNDTTVNGLKRDFDVVDLDI